ncbi:hypothetical protein PLICRDRAFT_599729 [Plicaturopsis crispa FD-325 SS-3]|nr:hypothetical protein PLICRDRAFT_599729 [Plicaturopsis crispa FD-325 SS-3]
MNPRTDNPVTNHDDNPRAAASSRTHYAEVQTSASTGRKPAQTANELQVPNAGLKVERTPSDQDSLRRQTRSTSTPAPESSYAPRKESRRSERATDPPSLSKASHSKSDNSFVNPTNSRSHSLAKQYDQPSGAQQFVSIRAAQGPSDPRKFYGLFKASEEPQQGVSSTPAPVMKSRSQADDPSSRSQAQSSSRHHSRDRDADRPEPTGMSTSSASAKPVRSQESQQNAASAEMSTARTTGSHRYAPSVEPSGSKRSHDTPLAEPSTTVAKDDAPLRSSHSRTKDAVKPSPRDDSVPSRSKQGSSSQVEPTAAPAATSSFPSDNGASKPLLSVPTNGRSIRKVSFKLESEEIPYSSKYPAQTFDSPAESTSKALPADQHAASASSSQPVVDSGSADRPRGDDSQPPQTERKTGPQDISAQPVDSTTVLHRAEAAAPALSGRTSQDSRVEEPHVQANGGHSAQPSSDSPLRQDRADPASQHNDHASYVPRNRSDDRGLDADRDSAKRDLRTADGPNANAQNVARPSDPQSIGNVDSSRTGRDRQRDEPETKGAGKESGSKSARSRKSRSKPQSKDEPDGPSSKADPPPAHSGSAPIHHGGLRDVLAYTPSTSNAVPNGHAHVNIHPAASGPDEQRGVRAINATASSSAVSLAAALPTTNSHTGASSLHPSSAEKRPDRPSPRSNDSGSTPSPSARVRNADSKSSKEPSPSALSNGLSMPVESTTYRSSPSGFPDPYMPQTYDSVNGPAPLSPLILSQPGIDTTPEPLPHRLDIRERSRHSPVDVEVRNVPIAGPSQASDVHAPTRPPGIPAYSTLNENSLQPPRPNYDTLQEVYATTEVHHGKDSRHPYNPQPSPEKLQSAQPTAPSTNPNPTTQETTLRAYARPDESHAPIRYPASPLYRTPSRTTYPEAPITAQNTYVSYSRPEVPPRMESRNALPTEYPNSSYTHMPYVPNAPQTQPTPSPYVPEKISRRPSATGYVPTVPTVPSPRPPSKPAASSRPEDAVDSRSRGPTAPSVPWPVPTTEPPQPKYTTPQAPYYQAPFSHDVAAPTPTHLLASGILPPKARSQSHENSIQPSVAKPTNYRPQPAYTSTRVPNSRRNFLAVPMDRDCSMSNESDVLKTPSSLAPSTHPTPNPPAPSPSPNPSRESRKKGGFLGMFRSKASTPEPYQPAPAIVSRPPMPVPKHRNIVPERSNGHVSHAAPVVPSRTRKDSGTKINIFSAFRLGKKNHTLSNASVDAQDGTATNTIVGSPTHSGLSQPPAYQPPPVRDPLTAAQEWRDREEMMGRGSGRRRRPGVVFDVGEDRPGVRQTTRPPSRSRGR